MTTSGVVLLYVLYSHPVFRNSNELPEPTRDTVDVSYSGVVTAVTKNSITVRYKNWPPREFAASDVLARGEVPMHPRLGYARGKYYVGASSMYRLTDVRVGDWVMISYAYINKKSICDHISITKRPGGKVPPLPAEAEALMWTATAPGHPPYIPYHERMQARWDLEDKGLPYPAKFGDRREFPVAPPPRPIKRIGS